MEPDATLVDKITAGLVAAYALLTFLASVLPKRLAITQILARVATDMRGVLNNEKLVQKRIDEAVQKDREERGAISAEEKKETTEGGPPI